jgi:hypothetical protein
MPNSPWQLTYQVSPIFLTGGSVSNYPGGVLPLIWLTQRTGDPNAPYNYSVMNLVTFPIASLDDAFGAFSVLPGGALVKQEVAKYPFANQWSAANATIREPTTLSVIMDTPMRGANAWMNKFAIMTALKATLETHNNNGGTYTVMTPAFMFTDMILTSLTDANRPISPNNSVPQNAWRFDFEKPLVSQADLQAVYSLSARMLQLTNGVPPVGTGGGAGTPQGKPGELGTLPLSGPQIGIGTALGLGALTTQYLSPSGVGGALTSSGLGTGMVPALQAPLSPYNATSPTSQILVNS